MIVSCKLHDRTYKIVVSPSTTANEVIREVCRLIYLNEKRTLSYDGACVVVDSDTQVIVGENASMVDALTSTRATGVIVLGVEEKIVVKNDIAVIASQLNSLTAKLNLLACSKADGDDHIYQINNQMFAIQECISRNSVDAELEKLVEYLLDIVKKRTNALPTLEWVNSQHSAFSTYSAQMDDASKYSGKRKAHPVVTITKKLGESLCVPSAVTSAAHMTKVTTTPESPKAKPAKLSVEAVHSSVNVPAIVKAAAPVVVAPSTSNAPVVPMNSTSSATLLAAAPNSLYDTETQVESSTAVETTTVNNVAGAAPANEEVKASKPPKKTSNIMCRYFAIGRCDRGDTCVFRHEPSEVPVSSPVKRVELAAEKSGKNDSNIKTLAADSKVASIEAAEEPMEFEPSQLVPVALVEMSSSCTDSSSSDESSDEEKEAKKEVAKVDPPHNDSSEESSSESDSESSVLSSDEDDEETIDESKIAVAVEVIPSKPVAAIKNIRPVKALTHIPVSESTSGESTGCSSSESSSSDDTDDEEPIPSKSLVRRKAIVRPRTPAPSPSPALQSLLESGRRTGGVDKPDSTKETSVSTVVPSDTVQKTPTTTTTTTTTTAASTAARPAIKRKVVISSVSTPGSKPPVLKTMTSMTRSAARAATDDVPITTFPTTTSTPVAKAMKPVTRLQEATAVTATVITPTAKKTPIVVEKTVVKTGSIVTSTLARKRGSVASAHESVDNTKTSKTALKKGIYQSD